MQHKIEPVDEAHAYCAAADPFDLAPDVRFGIVGRQAEGQAEEQDEFPVVEVFGHGGSRFKVSRFNV